MPSIAVYSLRVGRDGWRRGSVAIRLRFLLVQHAPWYALEALLPRLTDGRREGEVSILARRSRRRAKVAGLRIWVVLDVAMRTLLVLAVRERNPTVLLASFVARRLIRALEIR